MKTLLTFTGFHDPYSPGLLDEDEQPGPILSLVAERTFAHVILFSTPAAAANTAATREALRLNHPAIAIEVRDLALDDPTDYAAILPVLREQCRRICEESPNDEFFIAVASGTPQMHACWILLAASGEIPARILNIRPPRFVTRDRPLVSELDPAIAPFPEVRAPMIATPSGPLEIIEAPEDVEDVVHEMGVVAEHPSIRRALEMAAALAPSQAPILLLGETGSGKEVFARFIHRLSGTARERFVPVNCGAIPGELVESILFGHRKGSFTGATSDQTGKFDLADGGTLFLDEVGELPPPAQAKLLRVLEDGEVEPLGVGTAHRVRVRVIAATNRDPGHSIAEGKLREDLYYRLAVGVIEIPPLRERASDIPKIALHILDRVNATVRRPRRLTRDALRRLQSHSWPGNVRDLENTIERSVRLARKELLEADDLLITDPPAGRDPMAALPDPHPGFSLETFLDRARKHLMLRALEIAGKNQSEAARLLGVTPQAVHKFVKQREG